MSSEEAEQSEQPQLTAGDDTATAPEATPEERQVASVGTYTWESFMREYGYEDEVDDLYRGLTNPDGTRSVPDEEAWDRVSFEPATYLGFHPLEIRDRLAESAGIAKGYQEYFLDYVDPETTPVVKDVWTWEHFKWQYYYADDGSRPLTASGEIARFEPDEWLGFDPDDVEGHLSNGGNIAEKLAEVVDERTVDVNEELDEDEFFSTVEGHTTVTNRYDLEKAVPMAKKRHFRELDRYWVNKPYAFVTIFHSSTENETKYYLVEPYVNDVERDLIEFLTGKLRTTIKYADDVVVTGTDADRREVIERETRKLLERYDIYESDEENEDGLLEQLLSLLGREEVTGEPRGSEGQLRGIAARPEPAVLEEDSETLSPYQVEKILYRLKRDFTGYERIDGIKHDINVEDISCDGYNSPVFVYHTDYEQIISNVYHGEKRLDAFVVKLAQRSGKGISKRRPQVDATLPDGSRAQLTLGKEVSDHGTNYTIRQFKDVPFTPLDLICWRTFSLEEMAFLWLCIENHKSLIFAGGTASGKTTSLNAVSLFIPSNSKIVSIEDTREVELPQRNWIASVTRPSFSDDDKGDVDEFDLLEAALRQRPDYIVMGEIRGEEGRTLFQVMSTGHTTYTTFHADSVGEVLKRFTTAPINVSKTMFTALDLVSIQTSTRVQGNKVRRNKSLTEINHYDTENDEINVQDVYQWQAETDEFMQMSASNTLDDIIFDRGWNQERLEEEIFIREVILAYLIKHGLNEYRQVAATLQAFINDPETILGMIATGTLEKNLEDLRSMESVLIDVDPEKEALVPRPDPDEETYQLAVSILERAEETLLDQYRDGAAKDLDEVLADVAEDPDVTAEPGEGRELAFVDGEAIEGGTVSGELEAAPDDEQTPPALDEGRDGGEENDSDGSPDLFPENAFGAATGSTDEFGDDQTEQEYGDVGGTEYDSDDVEGTDQETGDVEGTEQNTEYVEGAEQNTEYVEGTEQNTEYVEGANRDTEAESSEVDVTDAAGRESSPVGSADERTDSTHQSVEDGTGQSVERDTGEAVDEWKQTWHRLTDEDADDDATATDSFSFGADPTEPADGTGKSGGEGLWNDDPQADERDERISFESLKDELTATTEETDTPADQNETGELAEIDEHDDTSEYVDTGDHDDTEEKNDESSENADGEQGPEVDR